MPPPAAFPASAPTSLCIAPGVIHHTRGNDPSGHDDAASNCAPFTVAWASCEADVRAAQRLRHQVFVVEMGAVPDHQFLQQGDHLEGDRFDAFCDHLLIRAPATLPGLPGLVIGTCRVLRPDQARRAGGLYCETEFDLAPLESLRSDTVELGRSCVHPDWRRGSVVLAMWRALGQFMTMHQLHTLVGCASVWLGDNGTLAHSIWEQLRSTHLVETCWQVKPRTPMLHSVSAATHDCGAPGIAQAAPQAVPHSVVQSVVQSLNQPRAPIPPLIKGYLRCGARLLGPPARDAAFNTADLPLIMHFDDITSRYRKHFLEPRAHQ